jgi:hypothetical protein
MNLPLASRPKPSASSSAAQDQLNDEILSSVFGVQVLLNQNDPIMDVLKIVEKLEALMKGIELNINASTSGAAMKASEQLGDRLNDFLTSFTSESLKNQELLGKAINLVQSRPIRSSRSTSSFFDAKNWMFLATGLSVGSIIAFTACYMLFLPSQSKDVEWLRTDSGKFARKLMDKNSAYILSGECLKDSERRKIVLKREDKPVKSCLIEMP